MSCLSRFDEVLCCELVAVASLPVDNATVAVGGLHVCLSKVLPSYEFVCSPAFFCTGSLCASWAEHNYPIIVFALHAVHATVQHILLLLCCHSVSMLMSFVALQLGHMISTVSIGVLFSTTMFTAVAGVVCCAALSAAC